MKDRKLILRANEILIDRLKDEDCPLNIDLLIERLQKYKSKYDSFSLDYEQDWNGSLEEIRIDCSSYETDAEYELRKRDELEISMYKQKQKKEQEQKAAQARRELYEKLKKEFEDGKL